MSCTPREEFHYICLLSTGGYNTFTIMISQAMRYTLMILQTTRTPSLFPKYQMTNCCIFNTDSCIWCDDPINLQWKYNFELFVQYDEIKETMSWIQIQLLDVVWFANFWRIKVKESEFTNIIAKYSMEFYCWCLEKN